MDENLVWWVESAGAKKRPAEADTIRIWEKLLDLPQRKFEKEYLKAAEARKAAQARAGFTYLPGGSPEESGKSV